MTKVVLITFAGRKKRMEILTGYIRQAMDNGVIDEWHIWDFTRSPEDHDWVTDTFGPVRHMASAAPYQSAGKVTLSSSFRTSARIEHDLHLAIIPNDRKDIFFEVVVGGWNNMHSAVRQLTREKLKTADRNEDTPIWSTQTPGILSPGAPNQVILSLDSTGAPTLLVNDVVVGRWPEMNLRSGASVMIRGGWGANLELCDTSAPVRRYIGNPNEKMPYWQAYDYYARRLNEFSDTVFLKCDDDIVYVDTDKLGHFIQFRRENPRYLIVSANVVNNGVCAYWQQQAGSIPADLGEFERPPGGFGGSLWKSAQRATQLHEFFLKKEDKNLPLSNPVIEWNERQSINFISWLGKDLRHMALPKGDDEAALSIILPSLLDRPTAIYADFTVSHLSFGPQEQGLDIDHLISAYDGLMREKLSP